jgi:hypothetical protein
MVYPPSRPKNWRNLAHFNLKINYFTTLFTT